MVLVTLGEKDRVLRVRLDAAVAVTVAVANLVTVSESVVVCGVVWERLRDPSEIDSERDNVTLTLNVPVSDSVSVADTVSALDLESVPEVVLVCPDDSVAERTERVGDRGRESV